MLATNDGTYPQVFNNDLVDASFGVTSPIFLDQITPSGQLVSTLRGPRRQHAAARADGDHLVTSFSSKSELALNLSTDGRSVTFMGYVAPVAIDVSNSNTPGAIDPTNPVPAAYYRVVAQLGQDGRFRFTETNAYSGNNGRAAILNDSRGANMLYMAGNAGNGSNPQPDGVIARRRRADHDRQHQPEARRTGPADPGRQLQRHAARATAADKIGKDTNFRGLTIFNNVVYYTKGSGGNGVNTVYFVDTTGSACPTGVGPPAARRGAARRADRLRPGAAADQGRAPVQHVHPEGFPDRAEVGRPSFPFGSGSPTPTRCTSRTRATATTPTRRATGTYTAAAGQTTPGCRSGCSTYGSAGNWPTPSQTGSASAPRTPCPATRPATTRPPGCRGRRPRTACATSPAASTADGTVTIWAITSTVSGNGDQGADPNKLVAITDGLGATTLPAESFATERPPGPARCCAACRSPREREPAATDCDR